MSEAELIIALERANARLSRASAALAPKHKGGEVEEFKAAWDAVLKAERALAAERQQAHAVPIDFPLRWDVGAPLPYLLKSDYQTFILFLLPDADPGWDGTSVKVVNPATAGGLAIVEFKGCVSAKMGTPNDEVNEGHPLYGKGFVGYSALRVENSPWIQELRAINSVHRCFNPASWDDLNHYIFGFHDSTFECVAESYVVETTSAHIPQALASICERLVH